MGLSVSWTPRLQTRRKPQRAPRSTVANIVRRSFGLISLLPFLSACQSDGLTPGKQVDLGNLYWSLELNHHAVTLSTPTTPPYDTLTLDATPRTIDGKVLPGLPPVTYTSRDPEKVVVTTDGMLQGVEQTTAGTMVWVVAALTWENLKHTDSVLVQVMAIDAPPPILASLSIHPPPPDSAKTAIGSRPCFALPTWIDVPAGCQNLLPVAVLDVNGASISGVPVLIRTSDDRIAWVEAPTAAAPGAVHPEYGNFIDDGSQPGQVTFYASTTVFGRTKADTLPFRIGWPVRYYSPIQDRSHPFHPAVKVGTGAIVIWEIMSSDTSAIAVDFADPTNVAAPGTPQYFWFAFPDGVYCQIFAGCGGGNFVLRPSPAIFNMDAAMRRFPVPGTYDYYSPTLGAGGRIIVVDER